MSSDQVTAVLPDGSSRALPAGATGTDLAADIGPGLAKAALAIKVGDDELVDLNQPLADGVPVAIVTDKDDEGLDLMRHSLAHVMAQAVMDVYGKEKVRLGIGPTIKSGFYYDFDFTDDTRIREEDLGKIEARMTEIIRANQAFVREEVSYADALATWEARDDFYKCDLIKSFPEGETISFYHNEHDEGGEAFIDLCRGPHVPSTGKLGKMHFKLLSVAGAYWRGSADNPMMQRVYAASFADKKTLKRHLNNLEEARKRDHRRLGKELKLFTFSDEVGPGLPLWLPKGTVILEALTDFLRAEQKRQGYDMVSTPHIGRKKLYETSGHWKNYRESMFPLMGEDDGGAFCLKPMNCPHHIEVYKADMRSYRDLPLRLAEFGTVYRFEQSGELGGLKRVRGFTVDDAHLFVTPDQLAVEFKQVVGLVQMVLELLELNDVQARVGIRDDNPDGKWVGEDALWSQAQEAIIAACEDMNLTYTVDEGEAAFYGPKLDFVITDALDREWQLGTAQVDYNLPERFGLEYTAKDGSRQRPIMIHRAPFGSLERLMGVLIEHYGGAFPTWLSPVQVAVAPIHPDQNEAAEALAARLEGHGLRVFRDLANEPIGAKIKRARLEKVPYVAILGAREISESTVSVRSRADGDLGALALDAFVDRVANEASPLARTT